MLFAGGEKFLLENGTVFFLPLFLGTEAGVGNLKGEMEKKGAVFLLLDIIEGFPCHDLGRVMIAVVEGVIRVGDLFGIPPEVVGVVKVGSRVRSVAKEVIEPLVENESGIVGIAAKA